MQVLAVVGIVAVVYLLSVGIHEFMHYLNIKKQGVQVRDIVLLGWNFNDVNRTSLLATGWVTPLQNYDQKFDAKWDCIWNLFINCDDINKYYGID